MEPIQTKHTTIPLGAPENWNSERDGECSVLHVARVGNHFYSYWQPSEEEKADIASGKPIRLVVAGQSHPPVHMDTVVG